jgi:hypothetical protein
MIRIMLKGIICFPRMPFTQIEIQADHQKDEGREKNAAYNYIYEFSDHGTCSYVHYYSILLLRVKRISIYQVHASVPAEAVGGQTKK